MTLLVPTEAGAPRSSEGKVAEVTCVAAWKIWRKPRSCHARIRQTVAKVSENTFLNLRMTASTTRLGARMPRRSGAATENPHGAPWAPAGEWSEWPQNVESGSAGSLTS